MSSSDDIVSVGLTARGREVLDEMDDLGWFPSRQSAAQFCIGLAIRDGETGVADEDLGQDSQFGDVSEGARTGWPIERFDPDAGIRSLITSLYPGCETPVRMMRKLLDDGLEILRDRLEEPGGLTPPDLFETSDSAS